VLRFTLLIHLKSYPQIQTIETLQLNPQKLTSTFLLRDITSKFCTSALCNSSPTNGISHIACILHLWLSWYHLAPIIH
jgi:hypothetical protein